MASERDVFDDLGGLEGRDSWKVALGLMRDGLSRLEAAFGRTENKVESIDRRVTRIETRLEVGEEHSHQSRQDQAQSQQLQVGRGQVVVAWVVGAVGVAVAIIEHFWK